MSSFTSKFKSTPTFAFKSRTCSLTTINKPDNFPSPNHYNPQKLSLKKQPSVNFTKSKRSQWNQIKSKMQTPGPGSHEHKSFATDGLKKTISKFKYEQKPNLTPSPNAYNNNTTILKTKSPSFTMPTKSISNQQILKKMNSYKPSPNAYHKEPNVFTKFQTGKKYSMGFSKRPDNLIFTKTPGPGQYNLQQAFIKSVSTSSKCKLGKAKRKTDFYQGQKSPGPGNYEKSSFIQENQKNQKGYSCRIKPKRKNFLQDMPGPGRYELPLNNKFKSSPLLKVPKNSRISFTETKAKELNYVPGPGSHQVQSFAMNNKFKSLSIHKFSKSKTNSQIIPKKDMTNISPSTYNINRSLIQKKAPHFSIDQHAAKELVLKKLNKVPGPAEYQPNQMLINKSQMICKIPISLRPNIAKNLNNPGPGHYLQQQQPKGKRFKFSKAPRININDEKIKQTKSTLVESYQDREAFPNPPKYMAVKPKIKFNERKITKY